MLCEATNAILAINHGCKHVRRVWSKHKRGVVQHKFCAIALSNARPRTTILLGREINILHELLGNTCHQFVRRVG